MLSFTLGLEFTIGAEACWRKFGPWEMHSIAWHGTAQALYEVIQVLSDQNAATCQALHLLCGAKEEVHHVRKGAVLHASRALQCDTSSL